MKRTLALFTAVAFALSLASAADAQKVDKNGRCHDAAGRFAKAEVCGGVSTSKSKSRSKSAPAALPPAAAAPSASAGAPTHTFKLDAKGKCRDEKGKMAKKAMCAAT